MPWNRTGTVAITAGQTTVTGSGTNFSANARVGDALLGPDGDWYEVTNIASATVLSILPPYKGATVSGGSYAITPIQGYDKSLRDAISSILQQWGSTLAGLGSVSTENVVPVAKGGTGATSAADARTALGIGSVATENVLPLAKGGTGGKNQAEARTALGLKSAALADILGTVSQSGGVPTGAIIERGSNANGEYTKFADGTLECFHPGYTSVPTMVAYGASGLYRGQISWPFPVPFISPPVVTGSGSDSSAFGLVGGGPATTASAAPNYISTTAAPTSIAIRLRAVGRWF